MCHLRYVLKLNTLLYLGHVDNKDNVRYHRMHIKRTSKFAVYSLFCACVAAMPVELMEQGASPPGLDYLRHVDQLLVQQAVNLLEGQYKRPRGQIFSRVSIRGLGVSLLKGQYKRPRGQSPRGSV